MYNVEENKRIVDALTDFMNQNREQKGVLTATLLKTQELVGYLPNELILHIARVLGVPASRIDNVAHYHRFFNHEPIDYVEEVVPYVSDITKKYNKSTIVSETDQSVDTLSSAKTIQEYVAQGGLQALAKSLKMFSPSLVQLIKDSGYKGRGDGGFVTGLKWELTANVDDPNKGIICNADSIGGVLDDKIILDNPFKLIEGMVIAGFAVSARNGYIYTSEVKAMNDAIIDATAAGMVGKNVLGSDFDFQLEVRYSEDGFVSPREVEVEGFIERDLNIHRERKVNERSFGVYGRPLEYYISDKCIGCTKCAKNCPVSCIKGASKVRHIINSKECIQCGNCMSVCPVAAIVYTNLVHNVETFINIPDIIMMGAEAFKSIGNEKNPGYKFVSLEGDIQKPGLIRIPTNTTLGEIISQYGGGTLGDFVGARVGGPIGTIIGADKMEVPVDFEGPIKFGLVANVNEAVSLYVIAGKTTMLEIALESARYAVGESCGKCTPCREGTTRVKQLLEGMALGDRSEATIAKLETLAGLMESASLCALGQLAPTTLNSILKNHRELL